MKKTQENFKALTQFTDLNEKELKKVIGGDSKRLNFGGFIKFFGK